jgi:hypothetical protein
MGRNNKEITKIRAEINKIETKRTIQRISETKNWLLERINKIDKHLGKLNKKRERRTKLTKLEMKKSDLQ